MGTRPRSFISGNICFEFSVQCAMCLNFARKKISTSPQTYTIIHPSLFYDFAEKGRQKKPRFSLVDKKPMTHFNFSPEAEFLD